MRGLRLRAVALVFLAGLAGGCTAGAPPPAPASTPVAAAPSVQSGSGGVNRQDHRRRPHVILISFDGFRADYLDRFELPNFRRVLQRGVRARAMRPVFPSMTFPNHYSLVTGLHPERHGIVGNTFYDPARKATYSLSDRQTVTDGSWYRGEPIWVTAERQGMVTAPAFWPGSEAAIQGVRPTFWKVFDGAMPNDDRVNEALEWLALPEEQRPHLLTLYFSELDSVSHKVPMDSPEIERAAQSLDRTLGILLAGLERLAITDRVYLVLTSDHGMVETGVDRIVRLESLVDPRTLEAAFGGPVANLHIKRRDSRTAETLRNRLNRRLRDRGRAYLRSELPARYHYSDDPRIGDVVVVMNESWMLATSPPSPPAVRRWGMHGWDPALPSMQALFVVSGPGTRSGTVVSAVQNVDVYLFLCELLGLRPPADLDARAGEIWGLVMQ